VPVWFQISLTTTKSIRGAKRKKQRGGEKKEERIIRDWGFFSRKTEKTIQKRGKKKKKTNETQTKADLKEPKGWVCAKEGWGIPDVRLRGTMKKEHIDAKNQQKKGKTKIWVILGERLLYPKGEKTALIDFSLGGSGASFGGHVVAREAIENTNESIEEGKRREVEGKKILFEIGNHF